MSGTHTLVVGDRGRVVVPAELRQHRNWSEGTTLVAIETDSGVVLTDRADLEALVRSQLAGHDLVADLLAERRKAAAIEDAA